MSFDLNEIKKKYEGATVAFVSNGPSVMKLNIDRSDIKEGDSIYKTAYLEAIADFRDMKIPIWTMNGAYYYHYNSELRFQMDDPRMDKFQNMVNFEWRSKIMRNSPYPIMMPKALPEYPSSVTFPLDEVREFFNINGDKRLYFGESLAYFFALAIMWGVKRIELYGCDYSDWKERPDEYGNIMYWIGQANARGVVICTSEVSTLMKTMHQHYDDFILPGLYGYIAERFDENGVYQ